MVLYLLFILFGLYRSIDGLSLYVCKHHSVTLRCPSMQRILIYDAIYGRSRSDIACPGRQINVTEKCSSRVGVNAVRFMCNRRTQCRLSVKPYIYGQPCVHRGGEYLDVRYSCVSDYQAGRSTRFLDTIYDPTKTSNHSKVVIQPKEQHCFARGKRYYAERQYITTIKVNHTSPVILPLEYSLKSIKRLPNALLNNKLIQHKALWDLGTEKTYMFRLGDGNCINSSNKSVNTTMSFQRRLTSLDVKTTLNDDAVFSDVSALFCIYPITGYIFVTSEGIPISPNAITRYELQVQVADNKTDSNPSNGSVTVSIVHDCYPLSYYYKQMKKNCPSDKRRFTHIPRDTEWPITTYHVYVNAGVLLGSIYLDSSNYTSPFFDGYYVIDIQSKAKNVTIEFEYRNDWESFEGKIIEKFIPRVYGKAFNILLTEEIFIKESETISFTITSKIYGSKIEYYKKDAVILFGSLKRENCPSMKCMRSFKEWRSGYEFLSKRGHLKCLEDERLYLNYLSFCKVQPHITGHENTSFRKKIHLKCEGVPFGDNITWYHNDNEIKNGNTNADLIISGLDFYQQGFYKCGTMNSTGKAVFSEAVLIKYKDVIKTKLAFEISDKYYNKLLLMESNKFDADISLKYKITDIFMEFVHGISFIAVSMPTIKESDTNGWHLVQFIINSQLKANETFSCLYSGLSKAIADNSFNVFEPRNNDVLYWDRDFCLSETTGHRSSYGVFTWRHTPVHSASILPCNSAEHEEKAYRECSGNFYSFALWNTPNISNCDFVKETTRKLDEFAHVNSTYGLRQSSRTVCTETEPELVNVSTSTEVEVNFVTDQLKEIAENNTSNLTVEDTVLLSGAIENIAESSINLKTETVQNLLDTTSSMMRIDNRTLVDAQINDNTLKRLIESIEALTSKLNTTITEQNSTILQMSSKEISIATLKQNTDQHKNKRDIFISTSNLTTPIFQLKQSEGVSSNVKVKIEIPPSLFKNVKVMDQKYNREEQAKVNFVYYADPSFFVSIDKTLSGTRVNNDKNVIGGVFSISVDNIRSVNLSEDLKYEVTTFDYSDDYEKDRYECVFWDFEANNNLGDWSSKGCKKVQSSIGTIKCSCNHMTNFAVLFNTRAGGSRKKPLDKKHEFALSMITYIGCSLSLTGILLTMITLLLFRFLRRNIPSNVLLGMCTSLGLLMIVFLSLVERTEPKWLCTMTSALIQYLILTSFGWMLVEAMTLYLKVVKVMGDYAQHYVCKSATAVLGIPAIIIGVCLILRIEDFENTEYCVVHGSSLYFGLLLPTCIIILANSLVFILVVYSIFKTSKTNQVSEFTTKLRIAASCCTLLGLTWLFGLLAIGDARLPFQYLFCIFNALQGAFIFYFNVLRQKRIQEAWKRCLSGQGTTYEPSTSSTISSRVKSVKKSYDEHCPNTPPVSLASLSVVKDRLGTRNDSYSQDEEETRSELSFSSFLN